MTRRDDSHPPDPGGTLYLCYDGGERGYLLKSREADDVLGVRGHRFWRLDAGGKVLAEYGPDFSCDCEYSFVTVYEMREGTLLKFEGKDDDTSSTRLRNWKAEVVCDATREIPRDDPEAEKILHALRGT